MNDDVVANGTIMLVVFLTLSSSSSLLWFGSLVGIVLVPGVNAFVVVVVAGYFCVFVARW